MNIHGEPTPMLSLSPSRYCPQARDFFRRADMAGDTTYPAFRSALDWLFREGENVGLWDTAGQVQIWSGTGWQSRALSALAGMPAATLYNFVSADHAPLTGLKGDGASKYVDSGRSNAAEPQNDQAVWVYGTAQNSGNFAHWFGTGGIAGGTRLGLTTVGGIYGSVQSAANSGIEGAASAVGVVGGVRGDGSAVTLRAGAYSQSFGIGSEPPAADNIFIFGRNNSGTAGNFSPARIAAYGIGRAIDLAALEDMFTAYQSRLAALAA